VLSLDGPARYASARTQPGQRFRVHERDPSSRKRRRGDLVVEVKLVLPSLLDERSKEPLRVRPDRSGGTRKA
jgi:DnaJ-class molecular chaperone